MWPVLVGGSVGERFRALARRALRPTVVLQLFRGALAGPPVARDARDPPGRGPRFARTPPRCARTPRASRATVGRAGLRPATTSIVGTTGSAPLPLKKVKRSVPMAAPEVTKLTKSVPMAGPPEQLQLHMGGFGDVTASHGRHRRPSWLGVRGVLGVEPLKRSPHWFRES